MFRNGIIGVGEIGAATVAALVVVLAHRWLQVMESAPWL